MVQWSPGCMFKLSLFESTPLTSYLELNRVCTKLIPLQYAIIHDYIVERGM